MNRVIINNSQCYKNIMDNKIHILIAECYSCQRDILLALHGFKNNNNIVVHSIHREKRNEILNEADFGTHLPLMPNENISDYILRVVDYVVLNGIKVVFVGKLTTDYEENRKVFEDKGIVLITGTIGLAQKDLINKKDLFSDFCKKNEIPYIESLRFNNLNSFEKANTILLNNFSKTCVKPNEGVYGEGFFILDDSIHPFSQLSSKFICTTDQFRKAFDLVQPKPNYIVMPYLTGLECSVDISCDKGHIISKVTRLKDGSVQKIYLNFECDQFSEKIVSLLQLDGLINIQFKQDEKNNWYALEVNARPSGGHGYSKHLNLNLIEDLLCFKLGLPLNKSEPFHNKKVVTITESIEI